MRSRAVAILLVAAVLSGIALFGRGSGVPAQTARAATDDLAALFDDLAVRSSVEVTAALEARVAADDPRDLALLGLAYQQRYRETGDPGWLGRADTALGRSLGRDSSDPIALTARAQLDVALHRFREAIPFARAAAAAEPDNVVALAALGDALINTGRYREAFAIVDRAANVGPSVGGYARVAVARRLLGRPGAALDAIELALEAGSGIREQAAWAETQRAALLLAAGRVDAAASGFRRALVLTPGYLPARAGLARVDAAEGRYAAAARRLDAIVAVLPSPEYAILRGDAWARAGRPDRARRAYAEVGALQRLLAANGVRTELQTALFDLDRGVRPGRALQAARAAYAAAPSVAAADAVAWGLARTGRCLDARRWSQRALRLGTRDGLFLFHRGMIERCLHGDAAARSWMHAALAADPWFSLRWEPLAQRLAGVTRSEAGRSAA